MLLPALLALFALPLCLALSKEESHAELVKAAAAGNGVIKLDDYTYDLLTSPDREWSASVVFSALDPRRKCGPCRYDILPPAFLKLWLTRDQTIPARVQRRCACLDEGPRCRTQPTLLRECRLR